MTSPYAVDSGQAMPRARALRRRLATASASGGGRVRSRPIPPVSIRPAAAIPVSRLIWAFHRSEGSWAR